MIQLSCRNVCVSYENIIAVDDVSFQVSAGDYVAIVGENGSGKSTLMKAMLGLVKPKSGTIQFMNGIKQSELGYLPQQTIVQKDFPASVYEVVLSGCLGSRGLRPFYSRKERSKADDTIRSLGLDSIRHKSYRELSGGQQQRVLLARALCATGKVLFLDEPVTGLDPIIAGEFYEIIRELNRKDNITVIMVSHDINTAVRYADSILHMGTGILYYGSTGDYLSSSIGRSFSGGSRDA